MGKRGHSQGFPKLPPGGCRQKTKLSAAAQAARGTISASGGSALATLLITTWAWGIISTPLVQKLAAAAVADGACKAELHHLAKLGKSGAYPGNMYVEITNYLTPPPLASCLTDMWIFMKLSVLRVVEVTSLIMEPHIVFSVLYKCHRNVFIQSMCGGAFENISSFWAAMSASGHPAYPNHTIKTYPDHATKAIPLLVHGDAVPVTGVQRSWAKSVEIWSWSSFLGRGTTIFTQFLSYLLYKGLLVESRSRSARDRFMTRFVWSLNWLAKGVFPDRNDAGKLYCKSDAEYKNVGEKLADGYCGVVWGIEGDLEHMNSVFHFPHQNNKMPCALCRANSSTIPWTDTRASAKWLSTIWSNEAWWSKTKDAHVMFRELPGVGIVSWCPDVMHCKHIGSDCYFYGSVLYYLVWHVMTEGAADNMAYLWSQIRDLYKEA